MNTTYFLNLVAGNVFGTKKSPEIPSEMWIGLSTSQPNINGTGVTEPQGGSYGRVKLENLSGPSEGVIHNEQNIDFEESTESWGLITHFVIYDSETDGQLLQFGALTTPRTVEAATIMTIKANYLNLSVQNPT